MIRSAIPILAAAALAGCARPELAALPIAGEPTHLRIKGISTDRFESHPAFDPRNGDLYFVRSSPQFEGWKILRSACTAAGRGPAEPFPFAGPGVEADPFFTPDGRRLYFISSRPDPPAKTAEDLDIWVAERSRSGAWGAAVRLPAPVNSPAEEWFPRLTSDGTLYFGSGRDGGLGRTDIYQARLSRGRWQVTNAGAAVNTAAHDYEFEPARNGRRAVMMSGGKL